MALVPSDPISNGIGGGPFSAEVNMVASTLFYDPPATLDKAERLLSEAASYGSQLVVFPKAFI
ncbi:hypothetical protein CDL15_Pgr018014 [Punica granatum]|nr:hypothetical protein CDL15_Pgr018014 [Punica granatum]